MSGLKDVSEVFPLSLSQRNIWNLEQSFQDTPMNNISTTVKITGRMVFSLLSQCLEILLSSDPSLRTRIVVGGGEPYQYHAPIREERFPIYDFSDASPEGIAHWEEVVTREVMPLVESRLFSFILISTGEN